MEISIIYGKKQKIVIQIDNEAMCYLLEFNAKSILNAIKNKPIDEKLMWEISGSMLLLEQGMSLHLQNEKKKLLSSECKNTLRETFETIEKIIQKQGLSEPAFISLEITQMVRPAVVLLKMMKEEDW